MFVSPAPGSYGRVVLMLVCASVSLGNLSACRWVASYDHIASTDQGVTQDAPGNDGAARDGLLPAEGGTVVDGSLPKGDGARPEGGAPDGVIALEGGPVEDAGALDLGRGDGVSVDGASVDGASVDGMDAAPSDGVSPPDGSAPDSAEAGLADAALSDTALSDAALSDTALSDAALSDSATLPACTPFALKVGDADKASVVAVAVLPATGPGNVQAPPPRYVVLGSFQGSLSLGGTCHSASSADLGLPDIFVAALDERGDCVWLQTIGSPGKDEPYALAVNGPRGEIAVSGAIGSSEALQSNNPLKALPKLPSQNDGFIALFDTQGKPKWSFRVQSPKGQVEVESLSFGTFFGVEMLYFAAEYTDRATIEVGQGAGLAFSPSSQRQEFRVSYGAVALAKAASAATGTSSSAKELVPLRVIVDTDGGPASELRAPRVVFDSGRRIIIGATQIGGGEATLWLGGVALRSRELTPVTAHAIAVTVLDLTNPETAFASFHTPQAARAELAALAVDGAGGIYALGRYQAKFAMPIYAATGAALVPVSQPAGGPDGLLFKLKRSPGRSALDALWVQQLRGQASAEPGSLGVEKGEVHSVGGYGGYGGGVAGGSIGTLRFKRFEHRAQDGRASSQGSWVEYSNTDSGGDRVAARGHAVAFDRSVKGGALLMGGGFQPGTLDAPAGTKPLRNTGPAENGFVFLECLVP